MAGSNELEGHCLGGRWLLDSMLGRGAFSEVWLARHCITGGMRAIKLLEPRLSMLPDLVQRFVRESQASARIDNPHVVSVDDVGYDAVLGRAYLVMELLRGESLASYLAHAPHQMCARDVVFVLSQVADVLDDAHAAGIVHRDLKPENIFLSWRADGAVLVKLLDFGILKDIALLSTDRRASVPPPADASAAARPAGRSTDVGFGAPRLLTAGFLGTPGYAAPEQLRASSNVTPAADVFALGICAYEMIAGEPYWRETEVNALIVEMLGDVREPPSQRARGRVPPAFDAWFSRACHGDPSARFRTAGEALAGLCLALGVPADPEPPRPRTTLPVVPDATGRHKMVRWTGSLPGAIARSIDPDAVSVAPSAPLETRPRASARRRRSHRAALAASIAVLTALAVSGFTCSLIRHSGPRPTATSTAITRANTR